MNFIGLITGIKTFVLMTVLIISVIQVPGRVSIENAPPPRLSGNYIECVGGFPLRIMDNMGSPFLPKCEDEVGFHILPVSKT